MSGLLQPRGEEQDRQSRLGVLGGRAKILTCQKAGSQADAHVSWKRIQRIKDDVGAAGPGVAGTRVEEWMVGQDLEST